MLDRIFHRAYHATYAQAVRVGMLPAQTPSPFVVEVSDHDPFPYRHTDRRCHTDPASELSAATAEDLLTHAAPHGPRRARWRP